MMVVYIIEVDLNTDLVIYMEREGEIIRLVLGMVFRRTGFTHLLDTITLEIGKLDEFLGAVELYFDAAVLEVDVYGEGVFRSLFTRYPGYRYGKMFVIQSQAIVQSPQKNINGVARGIVKGQFNRGMSDR